MSVVQSDFIFAVDPVESWRIKNSKIVVVWHLGSPFQSAPVGDGMASVGQRSNQRLNYVRVAGCGDWRQDENLVSRRRSLRKDDDDPMKDDKCRQHVDSSVASCQWPWRSHTNSGEKDLNSSWSNEDESQTGCTAAPTAIFVLANPKALECAHSYRIPSRVYGQPLHGNNISAAD